MNDLQALSLQFQELLSNKNQVIDELLLRLQHQEDSINALDVSLFNHRHHYIETSISELNSLGFVLSNGMGKKFQSYILLNVGRVDPQQKIYLHKMCNAVPVKQIAELVVPTEITEKLDFSTSYFEIMMKQFQGLEEIVKKMENQIQSLTIERNELKKKVSNQEGNKEEVFYTIEPKKKKVSDQIYDLSIREEKIYEPEIAEAREKQINSFKEIPLETNSENIIPDQVIFETLKRNGMPIQNAAKPEELEEEEVKKKVETFEPPEKKSNFSELFPNYEFKKREKDQSKQEGKESKTVHLVESQELTHQKAGNKKNEEDEVGRSEFTKKSEQNNKKQEQQGLNSRIPHSEAILRNGHERIIKSPIIRRKNPNSKIIYIRK